MFFSKVNRFEDLRIDKLIFRSHFGTFSDHKSGKNQVVSRIISRFKGTVISVVNYAIQCVKTSVQISLVCIINAIYYSLE